ncbi:MAG: hypothetical protein H8D78_16575 [Chloroflexi bacterium]|nr:hypothetical protein [Chloroflexota bacterium]
MSSAKRRNRPRTYTRASEVGQYAYCARAWWLGAVQGERSANVEALEEGQLAHRRHGRQVVAYHRLRSLGYVLLAAALLLSAILFWMLTRG